MQVTAVSAPATPGGLPAAGARAHPGLEFRHLRYLVAVADAGTFTEAAERVFVAQPTLSQQIKRLEDMVGTPLLRRRRDGVRLTSAGRVLVEEARSMLALLEHAVSRSRQAAGLGRPLLRFVLPPFLPEGLAVAATSRLRSVAAAAGVDVTWVEEPLDGDFALIRRRQADAGLGWLPSAGAELADPLEVMSVGEFEPEVWIPAASAAGRKLINVEELAAMEVVHGPRAAGPGLYDAWLAALRSADSRFEFTDPPFRSLPMTLAFAGTSSRPAAVLTGPLHATGHPARSGGRMHVAGTELVRIGVTGHALTATAAVAWSGDLPRHLQQVVFDTADTITLDGATAGNRPAAASPGGRRGGQG